MFADLLEHVADVAGRGGGLPAAHILVLSHTRENIPGQ